MRMKWTLGLLGGIAALAACTSAVAVEPFLLGVQTHFSQGKMNDPRGWSMAGGAGVSTFRDGLYWSQVEQVKGRYALPPAVEAFLRAPALAGVRPFLTLHYVSRAYSDERKPTDSATLHGYGDFARWAARTMAPRRPLLEIWNEWDLKIAPRDAASYLRLVQAAHDGIAGGAAGVTLLAGATTADALENGWVDDFIRRGGLRLCDGLSIHPYVYSRRSPQNLPEYVYQQLDHRYHAWKALNGNRDFDLYLSEIGWPAVPRISVTNRDVAAYLLRMTALMRALPFVKGMSWYDLFDDGPDPDEREHRFGLATERGEAKIGYLALREAGILARAEEYRLHVPDAGALLGVYAASGKVAGEKMLLLWDSRKGGGRGSVRLPDDALVTVTRFAVDGSQRLVTERVRGLVAPLSGEPIIVKGRFDLSRVALRDGERTIALGR